jgi:death-on-curing protein
MTEPVWIDLEVLLAIHDEQLAEHGGQSGVRDWGLLESAMARPPNQFACGEPSIARLAASYAFGISRNHPFLDGNKRTSLVVAELSLDMNGFDLVATDAQCVTTFLQLAAGDLTEDQLADWISAHVAPIAEIRRASPARESP